MDPIEDPGWLVGVVGAVVLDMPPNAVGWLIPDPLEPASVAPDALDPGWVDPESPDTGSVDPESPVPEVTTSDCAPPLVVSVAAALAEGGGTVRSLWQ
jgi:hypothetical protein